MKAIEVVIHSVGTGEEVVANLIVEQQKGEIWNRSKVITVVSGSPEASRRLLLEDNERLVIDGTTSKKVVYDREQNMAKVVDADPEVREKQAAAEAAQREANVAREQKQNAFAEGQRAAAAQAEPKTSIGNPAPEVKSDVPATPVEVTVPASNPLPAATEANKPAATSEATKPAEPTKAPLSASGATPSTSGSQSSLSQGKDGPGMKGSEEVKK